MQLTRQRNTPRDPALFPTTQLFLLALVRVAEPIAITSIFPYAWNLVLRYNVGDKQNASFYAGLLVSAFSLTESLTGMFWGALSDRIGRKPVLVMGCLGTVASLLVVGFSTSFWMALFGRLLGGALNGNIGVIQTMVGELVVNPKHEPKAYAIMPFVWSVGTIVGPSIGGCFASPADSFPSVFSRTGLFGIFPYLLPNLICAGLMMISIVAGYFCLEETHPDMQTWSDPQYHTAEHAHMATQASSTSPEADLTHESYGTFATITHDVPCYTNDTKLDTPPSCPKFLTTQVLTLTIALGIFTYHSMTYDHLLPIFLQHQRQSPPLAGGLGFTVQQVGVLLSLNGLIALLVQALVFPPVVATLGVHRTFLAVTILHPLAYAIMPLLPLLPAQFVTAGIYAALALRNVLAILAYPVLLILLKEAAPAPACLGRINGLAVSTGAACRTLASPVAGWLYGVGIGLGFTGLAWWASAGVAILGAVQALWVKRDEEREWSGKGMEAGGDSGYASEDERTALL